jgi:glycosyltransferase involved in cell wall biosynthesis
MLFLFFYIFIFIVIVQFVYYILLFGKFSFGENQSQKTEKPIPVSVIVCAKNEAQNITNNIPLLLEQNYPNFEIVLIDDASHDETLDIFEAFEAQHKNIKLVKVENNEAFWGNKKYALTLGIKAASYENLLFIDADCYPNSKNWISEMTAQISDEKSIVLGYGAYQKIEGSFLNKLIRFETLLTATQYFSWAKIGKPYMGVGRNLCYKKSTFFDVNGFINHMKIKSGDDDLFINEVATKQNTAICFNEASFTYSQPKETFYKWYLQKRRHVSTAKYYKFFDKFQLGLFFFSQLNFFILAIILLSFLFQWEIVLGLIAFRYLCSWLSLGFSAGKLIEKDIMFAYPILELALIYTQLNVFLTNLISKPPHWK